MQTDEPETGSHRNPISTSIILASTAAALLPQE